MGVLPERVSSDAVGRYGTSLAVRLTGDTLLFEVPEDTQRRLLAVGHVKPSRLNRILVSAAGPDQVGGLPGEPAALWPALRTHVCRN